MVEVQDKGCNKKSVTDTKVDKKDYCDCGLDGEAEHVTRRHCTL